MAWRVRLFPGSIEYLRSSIIITGFAFVYGSIMRRVVIVSSYNLVHELYAGRWLSGRCALSGSGVQLQAYRL